MPSSKYKKGVTLIEVLLSFAILTTSGVMLMSYLYPNKITQKAWIDDYGHNLSKQNLYLNEGLEKDTILVHRDSIGIEWETLITAQNSGDEICYKAISIRNKADTTRALYKCEYRKKK